MTDDLCAFAVAFALGAVMMLIWDALGALRRLTGAKTALNAVFDVTWWVMAACAVVWSVVSAHFTRPRMFLAVGAAGGGLLYHITISAPLGTLFYVLFGTILKIIKKFLKLVLTPAVFLYKILLGGRNKAAQNRAIAVEKFGVRRSGDRRNR